MISPVNMQAMAESTYSFSFTPWNRGKGYIIGYDEGIYVRIYRRKILSGTGSSIVLLAPANMTRRIGYDHN
jgi:hypothetical protein